jgi:hypothetical protein
MNNFDITSPSSSKTENTDATSSRSKYSKAKPPRWRVQKQKQKDIKMKSPEVPHRGIEMFTCFVKEFKEFEDKQIGLTSSRRSMTKKWPYLVKEFDDTNLALLRQGVR